MANDWCSPTDKPVRDVDGFGAGWFGAPRGDHVHLGTDYTGYEDQPIKAVCSGLVNKIGYPYADNLHFRYVRILKDDGYLADEFYVLPAVKKGQQVKLGQVIGVLQTLQDRYPGIDDHCHTQIRDKDGRWVDPETLIMST